jgi:hypothetical protein
MRASKNGSERCAILHRSLEKEVDIRPIGGVELMATVVAALFTATGKNQNPVSPRVLRG